MNRIGRFFYLHFGGFTKDKRKIIEITTSIKKEILPFIDVSDGVKHITRFFRVMSKFYDSDPLLPYILKVPYVDLRDKLETIRKHYLNAGRDEYGWNRTKKDEFVSDSDVFLGNIFGLWTKSVSYWKMHEYDAKKDWKYEGMENMNAYDVVSRQAKEFIRSHMKVVDVINDTEKLLK